MYLPKVQFTSDLKVSANFILLFTDENSYFATEGKQTIFADHPELEKSLAGESGDKKKVISDYVSKYFAENNDSIGRSVEELKNAWTKIEKPVLSSLSSILKTDWNGINSINWDVGIIQMYPRDLDTNLFQTFYLQYAFQAIPTALHEITHFIYFKKWHELFPEDLKDTFEGGHPTWHLSEMLAPIINVEESLKVLIPDADTYGNSLYHVPFNQAQQDISLQGYFIRSYLEFKQKGKTIEDFFRFARGKVQGIDFEKL